MLNVICTGSTTTISATAASQETSSSSRTTSKAETAGNTTTTANSSAIVRPTQASAHGSLSTPNNTASTGTAESPALSSVTSSHLALRTPDQHNKTATTTRALPSEKATQRSIQDTLQKVTEVPTESNTANAHAEKQDHPSYTTIILPVIIALIVISLSVFLLVTLYRMCLKTTPERQENGTEQAPSDKENVKLISVKTTSPENGMSSFLNLSSYDLPLGMSLPLEPFKPMRSGFSREE
ncbi:endomucin isoform X2 [Podarcis raffonei]|uniref:endomucin isoform X2 n=1 Tax=Podarcis raffonei TaxID=65483 RepID=UPI0023297733|nr:endomucin isoform X2 [Podarcis raffonei]